MAKEYREFFPDTAWTGSNQNMLALVAHPDDERLIGTGVLNRFRRAGFRVHVATATFGEKGKLYGQSHPPDDVIGHRKPEFVRSVRAMGARPVFLDRRFPDGGLPERQRELNDAVLRLVRKLNISVIYSFAIGPNYPYRFLHFDHDAIAVAAANASQKGDVTGVVDDTAHPPLPFRSKYIGWTVNEYLGPDWQYSQVSLPGNVRTQRNNALERYHRSQFPRETRATWQEYFDDISRTEDGRHRHILFEFR